MNYLPIDKNTVPYRFEIQIIGITYAFEVFYNTTGDFFTVNLYKGEQLLYAGEKVDYNRYLFGTRLENGKIITNHPDIPRVILVPFDPAEKAKRVGWNELGDQVRVFILTESDFGAV